MTDNPEQNPYRNLPHRLAQAIDLEAVALATLQDQKLNDEKREILEKAAHVARGLKRVHLPEEES